MTAFEIPTLPDQKYVYSEDDFDSATAAPLFLYGDDAKLELIDSQDTLAVNFIKLVRSELGTVTKPSVVHFAAHSIFSRMHQRQGLNAMSYIHRENVAPDYRSVPSKTLDEINESCEAAGNGYGTPMQVEIARKALGMKSAEYANLTIVGGARAQLEPAMWDGVSEIVGKDATPKAGQMYGQQVLGFDREIRSGMHIGAMRVGMKRIVGETEHGALVKARTTAIINLSPSSGFDPELIELFQHTAREGKNINELPQFKNAVNWLVDTELSPGLVLARNETVYGIETNSLTPQV